MLCMGPLVQAVDVSPATCPSAPHDAIAITPQERSTSQGLLSGIDGFFTENLGQHGGGAGRFYCVGEPLSVALGPGWAAYQHMGEGGKEGVLVRVEFVGGDPVEPFGEDPLPHPTNYFKGRDPDGWIVGARSYREVVYEDLWDGIDLVWRLADGALKYDLVVEPNADLSQVAMSYSGQTSLAVDEATGDLVVHTPVVDLVDSAPVSFQGGLEVPSRFVLLDDRTVSFEVPGRDPSLSLVIDPGLTFGTYLGGSETDYADMELDEAGDILLGGHSSSTDFPTTPGVVNSEDLGDWDAVILKLKGDGSSLLFSTYIGSSSYDGIFHASHDVDGNVVVTGFSESHDFPTTPGAFQTEWAGWDDCWVMKLNSNCSEILWCTALGGAHDDAGFYVEPLPNGDIMVFGVTGSGDFPTVDGCYLTGYWGYFDGFVSILDSSGSRLLRSTYIGGNEDDILQCMPVVSVEEDAVYLAMATNSTDFPVSDHAYSRRNSGYAHTDDILIAVLDLNLTSLLNATYVGGAWDDTPSGLDVDENGGVYVGGTTWSRDFPTTLDAMDWQFRSPGETEGFLLKLSPDLSKLEYSTLMGRNGEDYVLDIQLEDEGLLYYTMSSTSDDLPTTEHAYDKTQNGGYDLFIGAMDVANKSVKYGSYIGGFDDETYPVFEKHPNGTIILAATTWSNNFPTTMGAFDRSPNGGADVVVCQWDVTLSTPDGPGPPTDLVGWLDSPDIQLEWELPTGIGDYNLSGIRVYRRTSEDDLTILCNLPAYTTNWTDSPSKLGKTYHYALTAFSEAGESLRSNVVNVTLATPPDPPAGLRAEAGCATVQLRWTAPTFTGWVPLEGYHVLRGTNASGMDHIATLPLVDTYQDTDLENGQEYHYFLCSFNAVLNSSLTPAVSATPVGPPGPPAGITATAGNGKVTLQWQPPENDGGHDLTSYTVLRGTTPGSLMELRTVTGGTTTLSDEQLENGVTYYYAVQAQNDLGIGPVSIVVSATPLGPPGVPPDFKAIGGDGTVTLSWEVPTNDGGAPIGGYILLRGTMAARLSPTMQLDASERSHKDGGLENGETLYYAVLAYNSVGEGPPTETLEVTPLTTPDAPSDVVVEAGDRQVFITWLRPLRDGGSPVMAYIILRGVALDTLSSIDEVGAGVHTYIDLQVAPATTYYYAIVAVTIAGEGPPTPPISARPYGPPSVPIDFEVTPGDLEVALFWKAPASDGGRPITGYVIMRGESPDALVQIHQLPNITSYIDTSVVNGVTYHYAVAGENEVNTGERTAIVEATPERQRTVPGMVPTLDVNTKGAKVTLLWTSPSDDGGSPVTGYVVLRGGSQDDLEPLATLGVVNTWTDEDVKRGKIYYYSVAAVNDVGQGEAIYSVKVKVPKEERGSPGPSAIASAVAMLIITAGSIKRRRERQGESDWNA